METNMSNETTEKKGPSHVIWQVIGETDKARWIRVGAGWTNRDGKGLTLRFDAYPVAGRTVVREITEQGEANSGKEGGQQ
jgi:hypothetical protein